MLELSSSISSSMAMQPKMSYCSFKPFSFSASVSISSSVLLKPLKTPFFSIKHLDCVSGLKISPTTTTTRLKFSTSPADPLIYTEVEKEEEISSYKQKLRVLVKPMEKPRVVLKFIWMEKAIGIALNQVIPGHDTIPLTPYYFWPKVDAWEQLKLMLESKPWISHHQMVILLNQATDMIMLWQERGDRSK